MTHSGGKPHNVGDRGQRYEVTYVDSMGTRKVFGWSETKAGAESFVECVTAHPTWHSPEIRDRSAATVGAKP